MYDQAKLLEINASFAARCAEVQELVKRINLLREEQEFWAKALRDLPLSRLKFEESTEQKYKKNLATAQASLARATAELKRMDEIKSQVGTLRAHLIDFVKTNRLPLPHGVSL